MSGDACLFVCCVSLPLSVWFCVAVLSFSIHLCVRVSVFVCVCVGLFVYVCVPGCLWVCEWVSLGVSGCDVSGSEELGCDKEVRTRLGKRVGLHLSPFAFHVLV